MSKIGNFFLKRRNLIFILYIFKIVDMDRRISIDLDKDIRILVDFIIFTRHDDDEPSLTQRLQHEKIRAF